MAKSLKKLLIVDDDQDIIDIIQIALEEMPGVQIKYCLSAESGIKEALSFQPDFILIDVMMPHMDGIAMLKAMRLIPALANVPVAFLTAKIQKEEIDQYHKLGVKEIITKPFDPITLADQILKIWKKNQ
ncbi:MAG: response regulator [Chlamydiae bacterium]|nr:response regulator [Chlamydiota bacterium]